MASKNAELGTRQALEYMGDVHLNGSLQDK